MSSPSVATSITVKRLMSLDKSLTKKQAAYLIESRREEFGWLLEAASRQACLDILSHWRSGWYDNDRQSRQRKLHTTA